MADQRTCKLAHTLVNYCTKVQKGNLVIIRPFHFCVEALPLYREVYREILRAGGHPLMLLSNGFGSVEEGMAYIFLKEASEEQMRYLNPLDELMVEECDCIIELRGFSNTRQAASFPPDKLRPLLEAHAGLTKTIRERWTKRKDMTRVISLVPTTGYAQDAEMSLEEFEDFVYGCTFSDTEDPVQEWHALRDRQQRLVDWLAGKKEVTLKGPNIDISFSIEGRTFANSDGTENMPSGEILTSPVEDSASGWAHFTFPAIWFGREVDGIELRFEGGKAVQASAEKGEDILLERLGSDPGASYLGEFGIGTNKRIDRFTKNILFDEKIGGTIHLAMGSGFPECGGKNESRIHWDMICDMQDGGQILVDGELFYESGEFLLA
jgi:aminopeptidase